MTLAGQAVLVIALALFPPPGSASPATATKPAVPVVWRHRCAMCHGKQSVPTAVGVLLTDPRSGARFYPDAQTEAWAPRLGSFVTFTLLPFCLSTGSGTFLPPA